MLDPSAHHISHEFDAQMRAVLEQFADMARCCREQVHLALEAFWTGSKEKEARVEAADRAVDAFEKSIDELTLRTLALQQPVASDLRKLTAVFKLVTDVERIGDEAVDIARGAASIASEGEPLRSRLHELAETSERMFTTAVSSFLNGDVAAAEEVRSVNGAIGTLYQEIFDGSIAFMAKHPTEADAAMASMSAAKGLRRIAEHAMNIAEGTLFVVRGEDMPR